MGSDSDEDEDEQNAFVPTRKGRASKRRKTSIDSDDDVFAEDDAAENEVVDEGMFAQVH